MVDAGNAFADGRFSSGAQPATRSRDTDIIKVKNDSGDPRRKGEILKIEGNAIEEVTAEHIWLKGITPTSICHFGILKEPADADEVAPLQVSGVCMALVEVTDLEHKQAMIIVPEDEEDDAVYVLQSSSGGPIDLLFIPGEETGELECVVRFGAQPPDRCVILDAALAAASNSKTGATSCLATVCEWSVEDEEYTETETQLTVWNHSESTDHAINTFGLARQIDGHLWFFGDCDAMASRGGA